MAHSVWWDPLCVHCEIIQGSKQQEKPPTGETNYTNGTPNKWLSLSLISWPLSEQTRSMATSHFQPLTSQLCCQSRRLDGKSTGSTFSFRKPVGFQPCLLESNPEHRPTLFSLYPLCNTIKFQVKVWAGLSSNEWVLQTTALRKNTGWKTGKQFVSFLNLAVLLSFPGCYLYVQMSFILKTHTEGCCFVVVTAKSPSLLQRLLMHVFPFISWKEYLPLRVPIPKRSLLRLLQC